MKLKRIYDDATKDDGVRILVDRVWPRGVSKEKANLDEWMKEIGPSKELRKWFNHEVDKFAIFKKKYEKELQSGAQKANYDQLKQMQKENKTITLLFGAKDETHNQAVVIKEMLEKDIMATNIYTLGYYSDSYSNLDYTNKIEIV